MTQGALKVGEVVIGFGFQDDTEYNGQEGVVIEHHGKTGVSQWKTGEHLGHHDLYTIEWQSGEVVNAMRHNLKRKKPPEQKKFSGEEMVFDLFQCRQQSNLKILEECA